MSSLLFIGSFRQIRGIIIGIIIIPIGCFTLGFTLGYTSKVDKFFPSKDNLSTSDLIATVNAGPAARRVFLYHFSGRDAAKATVKRPSHSITRVLSAVYVGRYAGVAQANEARFGSDLAEKTNTIQSDTYYAITITLHL